MGFLIEMCTHCRPMEPWANPALVFSLVLFSCPGVLVVVVLASAFCFLVQSLGVALET